MPNQKTLLQISPPWTDEGSENYASFKCTNCYSVYVLSSHHHWNFCPNCGNRGGTTRREIKAHVHRDNFGTFLQKNVWKVVNGKRAQIREWVHEKAPEFTLTFETRWGKHEPWENLNGCPVTDSHRNLKRLFLSEKQRNKVRWRLIPSKPLPLP